ncbi:MAG: hypothetical protein QY332_14325 [Anaerolineales bacterium]|nr:MAG: hypothetical protein QY332_14325 [Anaerolineales bacterium]
MKRNLFLLASLLGLLAGCSQSTTSAPTPQPPDYLPTMVALTGQAAFATADAQVPTIPPTETLLPTSTLEVKFDVPSPTPTFVPGFTEFAQIRFISPGPLSSLTSPFVLQTILAAGESDRIQVDLLGEDGRVLQRILKKLDRNPKGTFQRFELSFEIRAVTEAGYIRISTKDEFGRIHALNTLPVLLYSIGSAQVNPPGNVIYERVMVEGLKENANYYAGEVGLKGRIWTFNEQPVFVELIAQDGRPLISRVLALNGTDTQPFETTLPYKVSEPTPARLTFRQDNPLLSVSDPALGRLIYLYSVDVILNP